MYVSVPNLHPVYYSTYDQPSTVSSPPSRKEATPPNRISTLVSSAKKKSKGTRTHGRGWTNHSRPYHNQPPPTLAEACVWWYELYRAFYMGVVLWGGFYIYFFRSPARPDAVRRETTGGPYSDRGQAIYGIFLRVICRGARLELGILSLALDITITIGQATFNTQRLLNYAASVLPPPRTCRSPDD